jgi:hypothetical protein
MLYDAINHLIGHSFGLSFTLFFCSHRLLHEHVELLANFSFPIDVSATQFVTGTRYDFERAFISLQVVVLLPR